MRSFLLMAALCAGVIGWSATSSRAQDEKPAADKTEKPTTKESPSTKPAAKSDAGTSSSADQSTDGATAASSSEKPAAK